MSGVQDSRLLDRTSEILTLEDRIGFKTSAIKSLASETEGRAAAPILLKEIDAAINDIQSIVGTTLNKGTASYGLKVLSNNGYTKEQLRGLAQDYNNRGQEFAKTAPHPYQIDVPHIDVFYMQNGFNFTQKPVIKPESEIGPENV